MAAQKVVVGGSSVTALQLKDFFRQIADGSLTGDHVQAMLAHRNPFEPKFEKVPEAKKVLCLHRTLSVGSSQEPFDADAFFVTRPGLWVSDNFKRLVLPKAKTVLPATTSIQSFDLMQNACDREIKAELPENHEVALRHIAVFLKAQEGGKSGSLLTNGYWNISYFAGLVVGVGWRAVHRGWDVSAWHLGGLRWGAGYRVFSSN